MEKHTHLIKKIDNTNTMVQKVNSLSIFFPCRNEKGTITNLVLDAKRVAQTLTDDFEVIVVDDGSTDGSREALVELQKKTPELRLVFHEENKGYGGALRSGFDASTKDLVFYTDGDGQYDVSEITKLVEKMNDDIDVVNGFKIKRSDSFHRIFIGTVYQYVMSWIFWLPIKDPDCDFRLIRRKIFDVINLTSNSGTICAELVKKIERAGFKFTEVGVSHHFRVYGKSQFFNLRTISLTLWRLAFLWCDLFLIHRSNKKKPLIRRFTGVLAGNPTVFMFLRNWLEGGFKGQKKVLYEHFKLNPGESILDIGCGTGEFSVFFDHTRYTGIDIEERYIDYARQKYTGKFLTADATKLPFENHVFDKVLIVGVLHHMTNEVCSIVLKEAKRVLKPDGCVLVMEDVDRKKDNFITRLFHKLDLGQHIRQSSGYLNLFENDFNMTSTFDIKSGVFPYQVFFLKYPN